MRTVEPVTFGDIIRAVRRIGADPETAEVLVAGGPVLPGQCNVYMSTRGTASVELELDPEYVE